jgi:hypothetical protein
MGFYGYLLETASEVDEKFIARRELAKKRLPRSFISIKQRPNFPFERYNKPQVLACQLFSYRSFQSNSDESNTNSQRQLSIPPQPFLKEALNY